MRWARTGTDIGLGVVLVVLLAYSAYQLATVWGPAYWILDATTGVLVGVSAVLRRHDRWRTAVAGLSVASIAVVVAHAASLPTEPGPATAVALAVLVASGIATLPAIQAAAIALGGLIVAGGSVLTAHGSGVATVNAACWVIAAATGAGLRWRTRRRRAAAERIRRDERLDLARELHDVVAHHISGIVLQAQGARIAGRRQPGQYDESLAGIETAGAEALAAMRRVVGLLRDGGRIEVGEDSFPDRAENPPRPGLGPVGLEHLRELVDRFNGHGPPTSLELPSDEPSWPPEVMTTVGRVVQESLTNVARHAAHASKVEVHITQVGRTILVEITDDAEPERHQRAGLGLLGLRERVEALGGTLSAGPRADTGWIVSASLPLGRPR